MCHDIALRRHVFAGYLQQLLFNSVWTLFVLSDVFDPCTSKALQQRDVHVLHSNILLCAFQMYAESLVLLVPLQLVERLIR